MATVLVADDQAPLRALVVAYLTPGHQVLEAADGDAAWALIQSRRPDVVLLDQSMPGRAGTTLLRDIRGHPELAGIKVLLMSGDAENEAPALAADADGFLAKPFARTAVRASVERALAAP